MTQEELVAAKSRMEVVLRKLAARTDGNGDPMPGFKSNVAAIKAELAQLQEQIAAAEKTNG